MGKLDTSAVEALARDPRSAAGLIEFLRLSNYRTRSFMDALDEESPEDVLGHTALHALVAGEDFAASADPAERLFALLTLGAAVAADGYDTALPTHVRAALEHGGIVVREADGAARAAVSIVEYDGVFVVADKLFELVSGEIQLDGEPLAMPPHFSTFRTLAAASRLPRASSLLDVGTGAGSIPLLRRGGYEVVTGIDVQPRAVAMARLNAKLNGRPGLEFVVGDCLTFADGRRYGHVIFNSPGEFELVDRFASRVGALLAPGGVCLVLAWLQLRADQTVDAYLRECAQRWRDVQVAARVIYGSPFSATRDEVTRARPRVGSYLTPDFLAQLRTEHVSQRTEVELTFQPSAAPCLSIVEEDGPRVTPQPMFE